jgi:hypothetical protein
MSRGDVFGTLARAGSRRADSARARRFLAQRRGPRVHLALVGIVVVIVAEQMAQAV